MRNRGYTLIELLITLVIGAVLLAIAVPGFKTQRLNANMTAASTGLISSFTSARAESVGRNAFVSVCKSNADSGACVTSGNWTQGWLTFISNSAGVLASTADIIQIHEALPDGMTARGTSGLESLIIFRPNGSTSIDSTQTLVICDERGFDFARGIVVSIIGKGSVLLASDTTKTNCLADPS